MALLSSVLVSITEEAKGHLFEGLQQNCFVHCFNDGYVGKQLVAWKEYCAKYRLKEFYEGMDRCTGCCDDTFDLIKRMNPEQKLHLSVKEGDLKEVTSLLDSGVDINCLFYGWTPLQYAISLGFEDLSLLLMEKGADISKQHHKTDSCPFEGAIKKRLPKVVNALLEKGEDPNKILSNGDVAIFTAIEKEYSDILRILLEHKADVSILNQKHESALFIVSRDGKPKLCQVLVDHGADVNQKCGSDCGMSPLIIATANEHSDIVKIFLKNGCDVNIQDGDQWTALWHAYSNSDEDMMNMLLKSGANKEIPDADGRTILQDAQENEDDSVIELLQRFSRSWINS